MGRFFGYGPGMSEGYFFSWTNFLPLMIILLLITTTILLFRRRNKEMIQDSMNEIKDALEVAKIRYAKGEITLDEYNKIYEVINK